MPKTYATVITGNLNQQSGDLNLNPSIRKLPLSPKSYQLNQARLQKSKNIVGLNPIALFDQQSNRDLNVNTGFFQNSQQSNTKIIRRRPQTTKRIVSYQK